MSIGGRYFTSAELACRCGQCEPGIQPEFVVWLDRLREAVGRPLKLTSAYRCPAHDAAVGGNGPHTTGLAVDIEAVLAVTRHSVVTAALALGAHGVGVAKTFVHIDRIRPGGLQYPRPALWTYPPKE